MNKKHHINYSKRALSILFLLFVSAYIFLSCKSKSINSEDNKGNEPNIIVTDNNNDASIEDLPPSRVIAYPGVIEYVLPDGYTLFINLIGDEFGHIAKTVDGYQLIFNDDGFYEYAVISADGDINSSGIVARNEEDRSEKEIEFLKFIKPTE